jgi:hypothetical protein
MLATLDLSSPRHNARSGGDGAPFRTAQFSGTGWEDRSASVCPTLARKLFTDLSTGRPNNYFL